MLGEMPYDREFIGMVCSHCGEHNTFVEVYNTSREPWCMSCARPIPEGAYVEYQSIQRGIVDSKAGRVKPWAEVKHELHIN